MIKPQITMAKTSNNSDWICTDPSNNQYMKQISENQFLFKEDRVTDPLTGKTEVYESLIDLSDYTQEEMFEYVQPYGYSFHEMCHWIDEGKDISLIAECIFEMEV